MLRPLLRNEHRIAITHWPPKPYDRALGGSDKILIPTWHSLDLFCGVTIFHLS